MKKGWKIFLGICGGIAIIGVICCITGTILGGTLFGNFPKKAIKNVEIIRGADMSSSEMQSDEQQTFCNIKELEVDVSAVNVRMDEYDGDYLAIETSGLPQQVVNEIICIADGTELKIKLKDSNKIKKLLSDNTDGIINIKIPYHTLEKAEISVGAGNLHIGQIQVKELEAEIGAGQATIDRFVAKEAEFHCGAGKMQLEGSADLTDIECGVGNVTYLVDGSEQEYTYEVKSSIGSVSVGEASSDGVSPKWESHNDVAEKKLTIECGIGEIRVDFKH